MKLSHFFMVPVFLAGLIPHPGSAQNPNAPSTTFPVLVELFTSQGCSSCPPAENLLNSWGMSLFKQGKIIPLAFHVDYWDHSGWKDPYSSALFTARQQRYGQAFGSSSVYTPQMVVSGRTGFVGSDGSQAQQAVSSFQGQRPDFVLTLSALKKSGSLHLSITVQPSGSTQNPGDTGLFIIIFENGLSNDVSGGENVGRTLDENFVVRKLQEIKVDNVSKGGKVKTMIPLDPAWELKKCGIVVFIQDLKTMRIKGTSLVYPAIQGS